MAKISVCLTHFNRPSKLAGSLESLARQTVVPDEVLVYDDASPNDPTDVALSYKDRFPKFTFVRNSKNLGMPGNLNAVIGKASGEYIANLHDADLFHPQLLERWADNLHRNPTVGLVFCGLDSTQGNPRYGRIEVHDIRPVTAGSQFFDRWYAGSHSSPIWGTVMVRRSIYERALPFDPAYKNWADVDMWMRICGLADIGYIADPLIILDNSETAQRKFSWYKIFLHHEMVFRNIHRMYSSSQDLLSNALEKQTRCLRRRYARHLAAGILRFDMKRVHSAVLLAPRIFSRSVDRPGFLIRGLE